MNGYHNYLSVQICLFDPSPAGAVRLELKNHTSHRVFLQERGERVSLAGLSGL